MTEGDEFADLARAPAARPPELDDLDLQILRAIPDPVVVIDEFGVVQRFSPAAEAQFGWTGSDVVGRNISMLMPPGYRAMHDGKVAGFAAAGDSRIIGPGRVVLGQRRDGTTFPMELAVGEVKGVGGQRLFAGVARDLTARQLGERRFHELQAELAYASRLSAVAEMLSVLAHELNQPLTTVTNYLQALLRRLETDDVALATVAEELSRANDGAFRAADILRRLRDFAARSEQPRTVESLSGLLEDGGALAMANAGATDIHLRYDLEAPSPYVWVNRMQMRQVTVSLMRNALEALDGQPQRDVVISGRRAAGHRVEISVQDSGPGVADEALGRLFEPFNTTKPHGMGMDLSIARGIVESHGGRISHKRGQDGGAIFQFSLPEISPSGMEGGRVA